jgi:hypothetical protein
MPAATTHVEFAKDVYALLDNSIQKQISDKPMYHIGAQGPDLLFFSGFSILPGTMAPIGGRMHDEKVADVISYFDAHAVQDPSLRSYFYGYLTHYALDSTVHPLVCSLAHSESSKTGRTESEIHFRIESVYDVYTLHKEGKTAADYNVYADLKLTEEDTRKLAILYQGMLKKVFDIDLTVPKLMSGIRDVARMTRLLKPSKAKYAFAGYMESLLKQPKMVTALMLDEHKDMRYLNEDHKLWSPVYAPEEVHNESFPDLYRTAIGKACRLMKEHHPSDFDVNFVGAPY